jgi:alpha-1,6-mannosyltransferase
MQLVFAYKVVASLAQVASLGLVWWLTGQWAAIGALRSPRVAAFALFAWSPLALFELSGNAHNEALMLTAVLLAFALLTLAVRQRGRLASQGLWIGALVALGLGVLVKFVPAAVGLVVSIVWMRRLPNLRQRLALGALAGGILLGLAFVVSQPWLDSSDILRPLLGIASGGERFRYAWQDSPADILKIKFIVPRMPDVHDSIRTDLARSIVWGFTRLAFLVVLGLSLWRLVRRSPEDGPTTLRTIAGASAWLVLAATLLLLTQVLAWYFLWTLPLVALLGWRSRVARVAVLFGLSFFCAFYLGELQSFGTPYLAVYAMVALGLVAGAEALTALLGNRGAPTALPPVTARPPG